jgi:iron complex outermembrane receptor protein
LIGVLSLAAMAGLYPASGLAQTTASTDTTKKDDTEVLEKFTVTGSYLPPAANTVATPVISVTSAQIDTSGETSNLLEVLRKTVPQFTGNGNLGNANANVSSGSTQGGSELALRNTSTLVLINGRRAAVSPASASGGGGFVDVNMIPLAAIERIDVLMEGSSAIYGTDAVAGVVNVILKSNYEGFEAGTYYGFSTNNGHYVEKSGYVVGGASTGKTSIT